MISGWTRNDGGMFATSKEEKLAIAEALEGSESELSVAEKVAILETVGEECVTKSELAKVVERKGSFRLYDGFEPSGRMHIAQGVFKAMNVNKCTLCGGTFVFWVADWFALMNDKMGGDLEKIKDVGHYLVEVWKAAGMKMDRVEFKWASEEITKQAKWYWPYCLDIARRFTLARLVKCCQVMGRGEDSLTAAQILYPLMQCTDVFYLKADICQLGVDQRKVNMLARDYCEAAGMKNKPIILSHHMLFGLKQGQAKMSKSDPESAVFMEDSAEDVERKILSAYCPTDDLAANPCLDYVRHIIFAPPNAIFQSGTTTFTSPDAVEAALKKGSLTAEALKKSLADALNLLLEPVRSHFSDNKDASDLVTRVRSYKREKEAPKKNLLTASVSSLEKRREALSKALLQDDLLGGGAFKDINAKLSSSKKKSLTVLFAPPASLSPTLGEALTLAEAILKVKKEDDVLLIFGDWSAIALDSCGGDSKATFAATSLFALCVKGLVTLLSKGSKEFGVLQQSTLILERPSDYWIDVINAGRVFMLKDVLKASGQDSQTEPRTGPVVAALLRVADAAATCANTIIDPQHHDLNVLAQRKIQDIHIISEKKQITTRLQPELAAAELENGALDDSDDRDFFLFTDATDAVKRKIKRAFCQSGNLDCCPPLNLFNLLLRFDLVKALQVRRSPDNGGDKDYTNLDDLSNDFKSGALHPGDLKPAVTKALAETLFATLTTAIHDPKNKLTKGHHASIKALLKKQAKQQKAPAANGGASATTATSGKKK